MQIWSKSEKWRCDVRTRLQLRPREISSSKRGYALEGLGSWQDLIRTFAYTHQQL
jgi:hypothetical protein